MSFRLITKVPNRPNFYFFDTALKDGKKLTVKFCLFTKDIDEAARLANSIKAAANKALAKKITTAHTNSKSLRALINIKRQNERRIKQNGIFLDVSEYKELSKEVIAKFYNLVAPEEKLENELKTLLDVSLSPKETTPLSFETVAKRYVQTECLKLKSSDKTKGYYVKTGKLLDEFFKDHQGKDFSYNDAENFQTTLASKKLNKKTINNYTSYSKRLFDYAIKMGKLTTNPFKMLTSFKISADEKSPKDNFSLDELKIVFDTQRKDLRDYMMFALYTGLRLNEIWQLNSDNVGEQDGIKFINVKTAKQKGGVSKYRQIPLHKNIEHLGDLKWLEQIKKGKESSDYFGKRLNRHIHKSIPSANVSFHRLRGNFAKAIKDYCLENSLADLTSVLLGHSTDLATDTYAKGVSLKAKKEALKGLDDYHLLII
ncbi:phage integrase SAM-like domain-containing protein [Campylobacter concisus]|uniref:tyrosine-type recombinase/integrase n=1 Tax=Campylobacter concisus TaxID=199 RepID=UPI001CE47A32|nr:phage integrase SAM-like domain-containing protein [Campylobacter concisus]MCA6130865.1 phage integrase SAM-like domain-containing protein [Campylobacter concisus]MCA6132786.1 phage integrase SAM-like domain-containing protein [Campylobacter concisus]